MRIKNKMSYRKRIAERTKLRRVVHLTNSQSELLLSKSSRSVCCGQETPTAGDRDDEDFCQRLCGEFSLHP